MDSFDSSCFALYVKKQILENKFLFSGSLPENNFLVFGSCTENNLIDNKNILFNGKKIPLIKILKPTPIPGMMLSIHLV